MKYLFLESSTETGIVASVTAFPITPRYIITCYHNIYDNQLDDVFTEAVIGLQLNKESKNKVFINPRSIKLVKQYAI